MRHVDLKPGDPVVYIPDFLLKLGHNHMLKNENLGVVISMSDKYIFVNYNNTRGTQATRAEDLYTLRNRPDLIQLMIDRKSVV